MTSIPAYALTPWHGLSEAAAAARLKADGHNTLSTNQRRALWRIVIDVISEPMFGLLLAASAIYLVLGDRLEAIILTIFASLSVSIAVIQETRSARVLEKLRDLTSPRALVLRAGRQQRIPGQDVVVGDMILLHEGDRVPADAIIRENQDLAMDESILTGEAMPVSKSLYDPSAAMPDQPGGDDAPIIYAGTMAVRGQCRAQVIATGKKSALGKIGQSLHDIAVEPPRLRMQTRRLVRFYAVVGGALSLVAIALYGMTHHDWYQALLGGIALSMALLPEEFPLVLTVFMVMGAWRIARVHVLTRQASAIDTLGATTVLCTDKTGTLTMNSMSVVALYGQGNALTVTSTLCAIPAAFHTLVDYAALASAANPFDPMEQAFHKLAQLVPQRLRVGDMVHCYGLRKDFLALTQVWQVPGESDYVIAIKGAPETVVALCNCAPEALQQINEQCDVMGRKGIRVLAVAQARISAAAALPTSPVGVPFTLLGLVGLADPLRPEVPAAMQSCHAAGIRVVMITGDYPATAQAIAAQAGIKPGAVLTGSAIAQLDNDALAERVRTTTVFARIMPEQKLRIVEAFKQNGDVVAMTGDGVNDAPALQAAHIGIAMGGRGTDVAREAASIVLLQDDFGSIVATIRLGRRIYNNLQKVMRYIIAVHVPIAGLALLPLMTNTPFMLGPLHIALLEMLIDPVCALAFEAEDDSHDAMRHPPRHPQAALLPKAMMALSFGQGALTFVGIATIYFLSMQWGYTETETRALTFTGLILALFSLIYTNRSLSAPLHQTIFRKNPILPWIFALTVLTISIILHWPVAQALLKFGTITWQGMALAMGVAALTFLVMEFLKYFLRLVGALTKASAKPVL